MINERREAQNEMEVVMLEQLVPQDHLLRKIDKYIDFSFIRDLTRDLYCHTNGRPAVDPVVLFKMLLVLCQYFGHKKSNFFMLHF